MTDLGCDSKTAKSVALVNQTHDVAELRKRFKNGDPDLGDVYATNETGDGCRDPELERQGAAGADDSAYLQVSSQLRGCFVTPGVALIE